MLQVKASKSRRLGDRGQNRVSLVFCKGGSSSGSGGGGSGGGGAATQEERANVPLPDGVRPFVLSSGEAMYSFESDEGRSVSIVIGNDFRNPEFKEVAFSVDAEMNRRDPGDLSRVQQRDNIKIANKVRQSVRHHFSTRPDGEKFKTSAWTGDGAGASRARLYEIMVVTRSGCGAHAITLKTARKYSRETSL